MEGDRKRDQRETRGGIGSGPEGRNANGSRDARRKKKESREAGTKRDSVRERRGERAGVGRVRVSPEDPDPSTGGRLLTSPLGSGFRAWSARRFGNKCMCNAL